MGRRRFLWATGGSVFPTSGVANPTLTVVALALRLADRLRAELDTRPRAVVLQKSSSSSHSDGSSSAGSGRWTTTEGAPQ